MTRIVIIGGGIAGVSCAQVLATECRSCDIKLISSCELLKLVTNIEYYGNAVSLDVINVNKDFIEASLGHVNIIMDTIIRVDLEKQEIIGSRSYNYDKLIICTGARPKFFSESLHLSNQARDYIISLRDTDTVKELKNRISNSQRVIIVGNGGIALELVYDIEFCQVIWVIKDNMFGTKFFSASAAKFLSNQLSAKRKKVEYVKRLKYHSSQKSNSLGSSVGPDWDEKEEINGKYYKMKEVLIEKEVEVINIFTKEEYINNHRDFVSHKDTIHSQQIDWPVYVELTNHKIYGCDCIISATGVIPNTELFDLEKTADGGILVNKKMMTSDHNVYAAGDACSVSFEEDSWFQMRLWSQARDMGMYCGYCVSSCLQNTSPDLYYPFSLFTHVTNLFGFKVILLGKFNEKGQEILIKIEENKDYVEYILKNNTIIGATLIGETDLEEIIQYLILSKLDVTPFKGELIQSNIDLNDYFD